LPNPVDPKPIRATVGKLKDEWSLWLSACTARATVVRKISNHKRLLNDIHPEAQVPPPAPPPDDFRRIATAHVDALWEIYRRRSNPFITRDITARLEAFSKHRREAYRFAPDKDTLRALISGGPAPS
jgi:hypothetical protein